jgi:hypothetical protein
MTEEVRRNGRIVPPTHDKQNNFMCRWAFFSHNRLLAWSVQVGCESICAGSTIGSSSGRSAKITQFLDCSHIVFGLNLEHSGALNRNIYCESSLTAEPRLYPQHQERHRQLAVQTLQQELHFRHTWNAILILKIAFPRPSVSPPPLRMPSHISHSQLSFVCGLFIGFYVLGCLSMMSFSSLSI